MLLLLRLQLFAAALLVFLTFDVVNADGSEMYYRAVYYQDYAGHVPRKFHVQYCWRKNPSFTDECLQTSDFGFNTLINVTESFAE